MVQGNLLIMPFHASVRLPLSFSLSILCSTENHWGPDDNDFIFIVTKAPKRVLKVTQSDKGVSPAPQRLQMCLKLISVQMFLHEHARSPPARLSVSPSELVPHRRQVAEKRMVNTNKKFCEELITYFPLIRHENHRKRRVQQFLYSCAFVAAGTCLRAVA
jgi:hypothetical protein